MQIRLNAFHSIAQTDQKPKIAQTDQKPKIAQTDQKPTLLHFCVLFSCILIR